MPQTTANLALPLIAAAQAGKHVTHNEALTSLDALVQLACLDKDLSSPPASPAEGDRYLVAAASPTGAWAGLSGQVVVRRDGAWVGFPAKPGWLAYLVDEADLYVFTGSAWVSLRATITALQNLTRLGVGTSADAVNRLAVKSDAALFSWDDATPGSGSMRISLNKQAAGRDAALAFQTGYATRALIGALGSDDWSLKVSADGASFVTALTASAATGRLTLGRVDASAGTFEVSANAGALPGVPTPAPVLRVSGADGVQPRLLFDAYGAASPGNFIFRQARNTAAAPMALQAGDRIGQFTAFGYGASGYSASARAQIGFTAAETWTDSAQGARAFVVTTPQGTTTAAEAFSVEANGAIGLYPKSADPTVGVGLGQVYANSAVAALKWHTGGAWARLSNFAKAAATLSADALIPANAWTKAAFGVADINDQGAYSTANARFVAPEAGLYEIAAALAYKRNGASAPTAFEAQLYKNGSAAGRGRAAATGALVDGVTTLSLASALKLAAGDAIEVWVRLTGADGYLAAADSLFAVRQSP